MEFSRENNRTHVTFAEFVGLAVSLAGFASAKMSGASAVVHISDDPRVLEKRSVRTLEEFTEEEWGGAARVEVIIRKDNQPFAIFLGCDRVRAPKRLEARTEGLANDLCDQLCGLLDFPDADDFPDANDKRRESESSDSYPNFSFAGILRP